MSTTTPLLQELQKRRVLICVGAGGVGKTTVSAALGLRAASLDRRTLVCTIDPARRLANSLGLQELGNDEQRIPAETLRAAGVDGPAPLHAMMLDMKRSWDELIERIAPKDRRARILQNRYYQSLSTRLAGSQEYIAMQKLWELHSSGRYQMVVLDTPPTAHALDFLEAPNKILDFLDNEAARWLLTPALLAGKVGLQLFHLGSSFIAKQISKLTGAETLQELAGFMLELGELNKEAREQAREVRALLSSKATSFVIVTSPHLERLDEVTHFHTLLSQNQMQVSAVVVNRVHAAPTSDLWEAARQLPDPLRAKMLETLAEQSSAAAKDQEALQTLRKKVTPTPLVLIPRFERDVHDLTALWKTGRYLMGEEQLQHP